MQTSSLPLHFRPRVYLYWVSLSPPFSRLCGNVLREVCEYLQEFPIIVGISRKAVWQFSLKCDQWKQLYNTTSILNVEAEGRLITPLGDERLFVCHPAGNCCEAYIVDQARIVKLPSNRVYRRAPGLLYFLRLRCVYLFGGGTAIHSGQELASSEQFLLSTYSWQSAGDMLTPRHSFSPCVYNNLIYLIGGCFTSKVETFAPDTHVYRPIAEIQVPDCHATLAVVCYPHELVILTSHFVSRWHLRTRREISKEKREYSDVVDSYCPGIRKGGFYYVQGAACVRVDLQSCEVEYECIR